MQVTPYFDGVEAISELRLGRTLSQASERPDQSYPSLPHLLSVLYASLRLAKNEMRRYCYSLEVGCVA
jgi:hypothetical protein